MAGVEAAGFILAVFPLLISAAEDYQRGFEPLLKWKRFRKEFVGFIDTVDIERHLFSQMMERFLISVAEVPQEELHHFMTDSEYKGWQGKELVSIIQARLGPSYEAYMNTLRKMNQLMLDLQELLCLKDGKVDWSEGGGWDYNYQLKRIRLSFSKKGTETVASLEIHNRKLRELLDSTDKLENLKDKSARKDTSWGDIFASIREHAASLHTAVRKSWDCNCSSPHKADLRLQSRATANASPTFNIKFETSQMSRSRLSPSSPVLKGREVIISVRKGKGSPKNLPRRTPTPPPPSFSDHTSNIESYTKQLRRNFEAKSTRHINTKSRPVLSSTVSDSSVSSFQSSLQSIFSRKISAQSTSTTTSHRNGEETVTAVSSARNRLQKLEKSKKSVQMVLPEPLPEPQTLPSPLQTASIKAPDIQLELRPRISFPSSEIHDLCSVIGGSVLSEHLGYLVGDQYRLFDVDLVSDHDFTSPENASISLEDLLRGRHGTSLNRQQRYQIAYILASSVLQLQCTPWVSEGLHKGNILFSKYGPDIALEHPYLCHSFNSTKAIQIDMSPTVGPSSIRFAARNSLSNLGIILLELCFGQVIEDQPLREAHLGADGTANGATDYMTARDWAESVWQEDPDLDHIIKRCVFCVFEEKADWNNKRFTQAVYCSVVEPLLKINSRWTMT